MDGDVRDEELEERFARDKSRNCRELIAGRGAV